MCFPELAGTILNWAELNRDDSPDYVAASLLSFFLYFLYILFYRNLDFEHNALIMFNNKNIFLTLVVI